MDSHSENIAHTTLVSGHVKLVKEIARDPGTMAGHLYQHGIIALAIRDEVYQLSVTKVNKARNLVDALETKVENYPDHFHKFLVILRKGDLRSHYADLFKSLNDKYSELGGKRMVFSEDEDSEGEGSFDELLPSITAKDSADDRVTLEHPPDEAEVREDFNTTRFVLQTYGGNQHSKVPYTLSKPLQGQDMNGFTNSVISTGDHQVRSSSPSSTDDTWPSDSDSDEASTTVPSLPDKRYVRFKCGCGNCSLTKYIKGTNHCLSSDHSELPQFRVWIPKQPDEVTPEDMDYSMFIAVSKRMSAEINTKFVSLLIDTFDMLNRKQGVAYTLTDVKKFIKALFRPPAHKYFSRVYIASISGKLREVKTFEELRKYLHRNYCSWFNYELIAVVRKRFLFNAAEQDEEMNTYKETLEQFVNRRCFLYLNDVGPSPHGDHTQVVCKVDIDFQKLHPKQIEELRLLVTEHLDMPKYSITLKQVREGCTELVFRAPACLEELDKLRPDQILELRENKFLEITIGGRPLLTQKSVSASLCPDRGLHVITSSGTTPDSTSFSGTGVQLENMELQEHLTDISETSSTSDLTDENDEFVRFEDLPTVDNKPMSNPFKHPPDQSEVGEDVKTKGYWQSASNDRTIEGKLLKAFRTGDFQEAETLLSHAYIGSCDVMSIKDVDKMTLLHLACRGVWTKWQHIVRSLVEQHHCSVTAVDEDGNTPLHVASRFGSEGVVKYLAFHEDCNPNAVNHDGNTALYIAVGKGYKGVTRALLSSGKVNQVIRSKDVRSMPESSDSLLLPQPYRPDETSPIQIVQQFNKIIEDNAHIQPPFRFYTCYCLLNFLQTLFQHHDSITLDELMLHIEWRELPLPDDPSKVCDLLSEIQRVTNFIKTSNSGMLEDTVITKVQREGSTTQVPELPHKFNRSIASGATVLEDDSIVQVSFKHPSSLSPESTFPDAIIPKDIDLIQAHNRSIVYRPNAMAQVDEVPTKDFKTRAPRQRVSNPANSPYNDNIGESVSVTPQDLPPKYADSETNQSMLEDNVKKTSRKSSFRYKLALLLIVFCVLLIGFFMIVVVLNNPTGGTYSVIGSYTAVQQVQEAVIFIGKVNISETVSIRFSEHIQTELVPIGFYAGNCTDKLIVKEIDLHSNFSPVTANRLDERYMLNGSNLTFTIGIKNSNPSIDCVATLVIFDNYTQYMEFIDFATWTQSYIEFCVRSNTSRYDLIAQNSSYYYSGLFVTVPSSITDIDYSVVGTIYQYNVTEFMFGCSILSALNTTCTFQLSDLDVEGLTELCVLGSVPPIKNTTMVRKATVTIDFKVSTGSGPHSSIDAILIVSVTCLVLLILLTFSVVMLTIFYIRSKK